MAEIQNKTTAVHTVIFQADLTLVMGGDLLMKLKDSWLINRMYLMVDFFFILSGFGRMVEVQAVSVSGQPIYESKMTGWLICLAFIAFMLVIASLSYRYTEVPARNYINSRFGGRKKTYSINPPAARVWGVKGRYNSERIQF